MFDRPMKYSLDGASEINGVQEKGKFVIFRDRPKEDSYGHLATNIFLTDNDILAKQQQDDNHFGNDDPRVIHGNSNGYTLIVCAVFLLFGVLALIIAAYIYCTASKHGNINKLSLKHVGYIRRRFDSITVRTPLRNVLQSHIFARFENDRPRPPTRNEAAAAAGDRRVNASTVTPLRGSVPLGNRTPAVAVDVAEDGRESALRCVPEASLSPSHLPHGENKSEASQPPWMLSTEERERKLQDREQRIQRRNDLFDRVLSDEEHFELYVVNEQQL